MPPFQTAAALTVHEDDGVVIYSRSETPDIAAPAPPAAQGASHVIKRLARSIGQARLALRAALRKRIRPAQAGGAAGEGRAFLGHDSGLRIAGATCIHRAPQR